MSLFQEWLHRMCTTSDRLLRVIVRSEQQDSILIGLLSVPSWSVRFRCQEFHGHLLLSRRIDEHLFSMWRRPFVQVIVDRTTEVDAKQIDQFRAEPSAGEDENEKIRRMMKMKQNIGEDMNDVLTIVEIFTED